MKKIIIAISCISFLIGMSGCLTTLHPIFTVKDIVGDGRMEGKWKKEKNGSLIIYRKAHKEELKQFSEAIQQVADKIYIASEKDGVDNPETLYYAFLVKLGKYYYLDYYPFDTDERKNTDTFFKAHYLPMHGIYRVDFKSTGSFALKQLDGGFLEKLIKNKQIRIKHTEMDDGSGYLVTASTEELQQYLVKYGDVPEAYDNSNSSDYTKIN